MDQTLTLFFALVDLVRTVPNHKNTKTLMETIQFILFGFLVVFGCLDAVLHRKQLSGPPEEFNLHKLPKPNMAILEEQSAFIRFVLKPGFNRRELWVDGDRFAFSFLSPASNVVKLRLWNPNEERVSLKPARHDASFPIWEFAAD